MKILVTDPISPSGLKILKDSGFIVEERYSLSRDELMDAVKDADALIVRSSTKVTAEIIGSAERLKVIGRAGVGLDNIDTRAARERGIEVFNTPEATSISVAELTMGLILSCARKIPLGDRRIREGKWEKRKLIGIELYGKKLGVIGMGRIGKEVLKRAKGFDMVLLGYDILKVEYPGVRVVDLDTLLVESDFITVHLPLNNDTRNFINRERIFKMKEGAVLINTSRGGIVDEEALYEALVSGRLRAAALDVFSVEPPWESKLLELDNVVLTPHIGAQTEEGQERAGIEIAMKIRNYLMEEKIG
jgi:D-3-phosphoglycerate dehydrogenase